MAPALALCLMFGSISQAISGGESEPSSESRRVLTG